MFLLMRPLKPFAVAAILKKIVNHDRDQKVTGKLPRWHVFGNFAESILKKTSIF